MDVKEIKANPRKKILQFSVWAIIAMALTSFVTVADGFFMGRYAAAAGMVIFMASFFFSGINSITSFYFTATGRAFPSAVISFSRGMVVLLACIFALPALFGMTGVWLAAPVTEAVTMGITAGFLRGERGKGC